MLQVVLQFILEVFGEPCSRLLPLLNQSLSVSPKFSLPTLPRERHLKIVIGAPIRAIIYHRKGTILDRYTSEMPSLL